MSFNCQIRHNPAYKGGSEQPRYFLYLDLSSLLPRPVSSWVEVYWRRCSGHPTLKEVYWVDVAGKRVEKGNLPALVKAVPELLSSMVEFRTFPYYYLTCSAGRFAVYHSEGKLKLKMNGSEVGGYGIGEVWRRAGDTLLAKKQIISREELEIHLLLWQNLNLYPTALAFKGSKLWIPLFQSSAADGGEILYDVIGVPTRSLQAQELFGLRREVAQSLVAARSLSSPYELAVDAMLPQVWSGLAGAASRTGLYVYYPTEGGGVEMPVYEATGDFFALAPQAKHKLYFGASPEELLPRITMELSTERTLSSSPLLSIERYKEK
jgi:hypothetical protein